ncbi:MAG: methyl-accepting chemotaxis protein, partial [Deltaproteobacteria bacterium]|nr:methyl-accepting chemotaxis protein [Candidatus Anaeroferrophillacea bacterium]
QAGAGFAVVAEEVRNLAMRAAEAARDTSTMIQGIVSKIGAGTDMVSTTNVAFDQVADGTAKISSLIAEIAAASHEQTQGLDQINRALADIDRVTQQSAANSEEMAAASEELNAQAEEMRGFVGELNAIITGATTAPAFAPASFRQPPPHRSSASRAGVPAAAKSAPGKAAAQSPPAPRPKPLDKTAAAADSRTVRPEEVIPFDDDEGSFEDF